MSAESYAVDNVIEIGGTVLKIGAVMSLATARMLATVIENAVKASNGRDKKDALGELIESKRDLRVFPVFKSDVPAFQREARRMNLRYCIIDDRGSSSDIAPLIVYREDENAMNRIYEKLRMYEYKSFPTRPGTEEEAPSGKSSIEEQKEENIRREENAATFARAAYALEGLRGRILDQNMSQYDPSRYEGDRIGEVAASRESVRAAMEKLRAARESFSKDNGRSIGEAR